MTQYDQALAVAVEAARAAGALLREDFHRPGGPRGHGDHADADTEAEHLIRDKLLAAFPWKYRGEELGFQDSAEPQHLWLVDPNDGTVSYLKGRRGSAVSIAALRDGVPILGVVFAFAYPDDTGDLIAWAEGCVLTRNGRELQVNLADSALTERTNPPPAVFVSQDADRNPAANTQCVSPARYVSLPSIAYRMARAACGDGVAGLSLSGPVAWDYAAGHALLRAVGGGLVDEDGKEVAYSPLGESRTVRCFGGAPAVVGELCRRDWNAVFDAPDNPQTSPFPLVQPVRGVTIADAAMLARAQGCLLGQFAGDALGGLVEFQAGSEIRASHPAGVRDLKDGGNWANLAGQPTDDSELALMLARCLVRDQRFDAEQVFDAYVHWFQSRPFDMGFTTSGALGARIKNLASQANGSLMRISPLGVFAVHQPTQAAEWARADSRLTHPHPVCQDCCAVFVAALIAAIGKGGNASVCYEAAQQEAARDEVQAAVRLALVDARHTPPTVYDDGKQGWVLIAFQNAFYQLLHAPSLEEGVIDTVMRGGDTDTNGAIAGALLGAVHGRDAVPTRWLMPILACRPLPKTRTAHPRPVEFWPVDVLELAEALLIAGK